MRSALHARPIRVRAAVRRRSRGWRRWRQTSSIEIRCRARDLVCRSRRFGRQPIYYVIGYGGTLNIPTLDIISTERNIIGNIVGTYNDLVELMALAQGGKVTLHTKTYPLDAAPDAFADLDAGRVRGRAILVP